MPYAADSANLPNKLATMIDRVADLGMLRMLRSVKPDTKKSRELALRLPMTISMGVGTKYAGISVKPINTV